ncbi:MAG: terminase large subunit [Caulobacter sp.]|nr:terminase large subunit [Caulobacter sp.]
MADKVKAPPRPAALARYPNARWDGEVWRDGRFWFDERAAEKAAEFFPRHLRLTTGEWANKPFVLQPWQEHDIVRPLFGWKREDGTRRYRRCFVWVARKNGKTELAAGIALLMLLGDAEPAGEVYSIASEGDQARIVFEKAAMMVAYSASLSSLIECLKHSIYVPQLNASFKALSGKPQGKHGLNMSGLIGDEVHEWKSGDLYTFIHDSCGTRRQPLEVMISTAGVKGTHGEEVWKECEAILSGDIEDDETLVVVYAAGAEDDWKDEKTWRKANPNYGETVKVDSFLADFNRARQTPRLENDFKRYRLNMWTEQMVRWLPIDAVDDAGKAFGWDHCAGPVDWKALEARLAGKRCFGGLDLSAVQDLSALLWWFPVQEGLDTPALLARFWKPRDLLKEHGRRDRLPYEQWVRDGALLTTDGNVIDHEAIRRQVIADAEVFNVAHMGEPPSADTGGIAIDRFDATETLVKLMGEGLPVVKYGQGFVSMSGPAKELERLVLANAFHHGGHPVLARHARAVAIQTDPAGNIKPAKDKSSQRIDGIVALCMALGIAAQDRGSSMMITASDALMVI